MEWLTIGIIIGVAALIVISIIVFFVVRSQLIVPKVVENMLEMKEKLAQQQNVPARVPQPKKDFFRAHSGEREKQIQAIPTKQPATTLDAIFQKIPEPPKPKAILFLDFDHTISVNHMWDATGGLNDRKLLTNEKVMEIFGSQEYLNRFKNFWKQLNEIPGLEIQIVSRSYENMLRAVLQKIQLSPRPTKIVGREILTNFQLKKGNYVNAELATGKYDFVFFADDTPEEREQMHTLVPQAIICCDDLKNGLSADNMNTILTNIKKALHV